MAGLSSTRSGSVSISATTSSASTALPTGAAAATSIDVINQGTATVFITTGVGSATATTSSNPVLSGQRVTISKPIGDDTVAAITAASTATAYFVLSNT